MENKEKRKGLRSLFVFIPTMIIIAILHIFVIVIIVLISSISNEMSTTMQQSANYISAISSLQSGTSMLSETSTTFCYQAKHNEEFNSGSLIAYLNEYPNPRRPKDILPQFDNYNLDDNVKTNVKIACENADEMLKYQAHALYLVKSVYGNQIPPVADFSVIPSYTLTADEEALTNDERLQLAIDILYSDDYTKFKSQLSEKAGAANTLIQSNASEKQSKLTVTISSLRRALWILTTVIIIVLLTFFMFLFGKLVIPISRFSKKIKNNEFLNETKSLYEANLLASTYNKLLTSRNEFESKLKKAAETDTLTGLPNRFSYNEFIKHDKTSTTACILLFDINNLKTVNDNQGHDKGDELIVSAARCISDVFNEISDNKVYRLGGDEFAAIVNNLPENEIKTYIDEFFKKQPEYNVSIAIGYSYTEDISNTSYKKLLIKADLEMYNKKSEMKQQMNT